MNSHVNENKICLPFKTDAKFYSHGSTTSTNLILLLHGYAESGSVILEKTYPYLPKDAFMVAPNGPFPFVVKNRESKKLALGYSWYFYNPETDEYVVNMNSAISYLESFISNIPNSAFKRITVIGYSQGGYLAPFFANQTKKVDHVIGLSCRFTDEELPENLPFKLDAIHGSLDEVIDPNGSMKSFVQLKTRTIGGDFYLIEGSTHTLDEKILGKMKELF